VFEPLKHPFWGNPNARVSDIDTSGGIASYPAAVGGTITVYTPGFVHLSGSAITSTGIIVDSDEVQKTGLFHVPYSDLEFRWEGGDATGADRIDNPKLPGETVNTNFQLGPEAVFCYRTAGTFTPKLYVRAIASVDGSGVPTYDEREVGGITVNVVAFTSHPSYSGTRYIDPDLGNDNWTGTTPERDGLTTTGPWATFGNVGADTTNGRRYAIKSGTAALSVGKTGLNASHLRITSYSMDGVDPVFPGVGTKPMLQSHSQWLEVRLLATRQNVVVGDVDVEIVDILGVHGHIIDVGTDDFGGNLNQWYVDNVDFHSDIGHGRNGFVISGSGYFGAGVSNGTGTWNCTFTNPEAVTSPVNNGWLSGGAYSWIFNIGGHVGGSAGSDAMHHSQYAAAHDHGCFRWTRWDLVRNGANAINYNFEWPFGSPHDDVPPAWDYPRYHLIADSVFIGGDFAGMEWSLGTRNVFFREVIVERCHGRNMGALDGDGGWFTWHKGAIEATYRDNEIWECNLGGGVAFHNSNAVPLTEYEIIPPYMTDTDPPRAIYKQYRNKSHRKSGSSTVPSYLWDMGGVCQFTDNEIEDDRSGQRALINNWRFDWLVTYGALVDRNRYYTPNYSGPRLVYEGNRLGHFARDIQLRNQQCLRSECRHNCSDLG
jgi:hypothetical protein